MEHKHDVVIIGSGLGGLECGLMLAKEGWDVCLLEQDAFFGGCFRSFLRKGRHIDTGIHFVGSMGEGQILRQYFKYFGLMDSLSVVALDNDFDTICFPRGEEYRHVHGYEGFIGTLSEQFPSEREGLVRYCRKIKEIGETISVDVHRSGKLSSGGLGNLGTQAWAFICDCVSDPLLRQVLAGNNPLYGGRKDASNLYHPAMITHSNIEGCYRFAGGTQKVADLLAEEWGHTVCRVDLADPGLDAREAISLPEADLALIAVPSYAGRVPAVAAERLGHIRADGMKCVLVCVYGNRAYEDTLVELQDRANACGFAVTAAVAAIAAGLCDRQVTVRMDGGPLTIEWRADDGHVYMTGEARTVYEGTIHII